MRIVPPLLALLMACEASHIEFTPEIYGVEPETWLPGTRVAISGKGFIPVLDANVTVSGVSGGSAYQVTTALTTIGLEQASFVVTENVLAALPVDREPLVGSITLEFRYNDETWSVKAPIKVRVVTKLVPKVFAIEPQLAFPGEEMSIEGEDLLLGGEGIVVLTLNGRYNEAPVKGREVQVFTVSRTRATFVLGPEVLGPVPGVFEGDVWITNIGGQASAISNSIHVHLEVSAPRLDAIYPSVVRRGQVLRFLGKGFLRQGDVATTFFTLERQDSTLELIFPDAVVGNELATVLVRDFEDGLFSPKTTLKGRFKPFIATPEKVIEGYGLDCDIRIGNTIQVVYIKLLPSFRKGLAYFGLEEVADAIMKRALEVCRGDYAQFAVEFRTEEPNDFIEYTTIEVMDKDPNGLGLIGLDNTPMKDEGNKRLDEYLGGYNAEADEEGFCPYGGIFVESFAVFSATKNPGEWAAPEFDKIFAQFYPDGAGKPIAKGEWPGGKRGAEIELAIWVMGNLIGDAISHELGHALGLPAIPGELHDPGDNEGYIMDAGVFRPFAERAQLPGAAPRIFAPYDRAYLETILPLE